MVACLELGKAKKLGSRRGGKSPPAWPGLRVLAGMLESGEPPEGQMDLQQLRAVVPDEREAVPLPPPSGEGL